MCQYLLSWLFKLKFTICKYNRKHIIHNKCYVLSFDNKFSAPANCRSVEIEITIIMHVLSSVAVVITHLNVWMSHHSWSRRANSIQSINEHIHHTEHSIVEFADMYCRIQITVWIFVVCRGDSFSNFPIINTL